METLGFERDLGNATAQAPNDTDRKEQTELSNCAQCPALSGRAGTSTDVPRQPAQGSVISELTSGSQE